MWWRYVWPQLTDELTCEQSFSASFALVMNSLTIRTAHVADAEMVARHVNACYRGDYSKQGWTTEADLLDGNRTDQEEVTSLIQGGDSEILLCFDEAVLVASVHLKRTGHVVEIGMLAIEPTRQGQGVGGWVLAQAENHLLERWGVTAVQMSVFTVRSELISFYERRGYHRTGILKPFTLGERNGIPRQPLQFELLEKSLERIAGH